MTQQEAERRAQQLADHFDDAKDLRFYLKCVYRLSEGQIQNIKEKAAKATTPIYYFKRAAGTEMKK